MYTQAEFDKLLGSHRLWRTGDDKLGCQLYISGSLMKGLQLSKQYLGKSMFYACDFDSVDVSATSFEDATLHRCEFFKANLQSTDFSGADMSDNRFQGAQLQNSTWSNAKAGSCYFADANLQGASFYRADLNHCDFTGADLYGAHFLCCNLSGCKGIVSVNFDPRGYSLVMWRNKEGIRMFNAGCRNFTYDEALEHWGDGYSLFRAELGNAYCAAVKFLNELPATCFCGYTV